MKLLSIALGMGLGLAANAHAGVTLAGDIVDAGMYRTVDTGRGVGRITGFGLDAPFMVQDGPADQKKYSVAYTLDVNGDGFLMDYVNPFQWGAGIVFRLSDLDFSHGASLATLIVDTNMSGYGLNIGADFIELDLTGMRGDGNVFFKGTFVTAAATDVPEPAPLALLALGLAGAGWVRRRG